MFHRKLAVALFIISQMFSFVVSSSGAEVKYIELKTTAPNNKLLKFYYRIPTGYDPKSKQLYRVLVIFGGRNCKGQSEASGGLGFAKWADEHDIFLVGPGFKDDNYWQPERWSGTALFYALKQIKTKYNINDKKIMYYGWSGGSQCSNLFPAWKPELCIAWVSHGCGVFHKPAKRMMNCPGLVTCGDADIMRYILTRNFVSESRKLGLNILWKSYPNLPHEVPKESTDLAREFLAYYHEQNIGDLQTGPYSAGSRKRKLLYVGDDQENRFWSANDRAVKNIEPEDRVEFYARELALAWGEEAKPK
ncbi:MAG: hypothetical protein ACYC4Q_05565 [Victivallaceae bacterium]